MQHQFIEINKLERSSQNARRTVIRGAAEDLKASIIAHGILHLLGWDHDTAAKDRAMRAETERLCRAAARAQMRFSRAR